MYTVSAYNHSRQLCYEETYLDFDYAHQTFITATKCVDCGCAIITSAITGEIVMEYSYSKKTITDYR